MSVEVTVIDRTDLYVYGPRFGLLPGLAEPGHAADHASPFTDPGNGQSASRFASLIIGATAATVNLTITDSPDPTTLNSKTPTSRRNESASGAARTVEAPR